MIPGLNGFLSNELLGKIIKKIVCFHGHGLSVLYKNRIWYLQYFDLTRSEWDDTMCLNQCIEYRIEVHQPKSNPLEAPGHESRRKGGEPKVLRCREAVHLAVR